MESVKEFLQEQNNNLEKVYTKLTYSYLDAILSGNPEKYKEYEENSIKYQEFFNDKENFQRVKQFLEADISEPLVKRQLEILYNNYLGNQADLNLIKQITLLSTKIEQSFNTFRAKVDGKDLTDNEISDMLKNEKDSKKLQSVWNASKKQGASVAKEVILLVKLRNKLAKSIGFNNYYEMSLKLSEQDPVQIKNLFDELDALTRPEFEKTKDKIDDFLTARFKINKKELKPWHYQDLFFQKEINIFNSDFDAPYKKDILSIAKNFYESIGLDVKGILERSDLYERSGKYQHACCIDLNRKGDVRIVENLKNEEKWMETTLHELGHGVYSQGINMQLPFILIDSAHILTTEAIAMMFGRQAKNKSFIKKYTGCIDKNLINDLESSLKISVLVFSRWAQVMVNFERELYSNPDQDLNRLWWQLVKKYQMIDFSRDESDWASKIHLVSVPVYYHNYLLGELMASQVHNFIVKNILKDSKINEYDYNTPEVGNYLKEKIFYPGLTLKWNDLIKNATSEFLNPKYLAKQFLE